ncbi:MAG: hypothetical protein H6581_10945 [Bacteroidia bacterium]|nr:hypothetical protein [Bacteroidia bacterium]
MFKYLLPVLMLLQFPLQAQITRVAHRGGRTLAPENTLAALRAGMEYPIDFCEIDVHQTRDTVVVLHHDETLDRCTNGSGRIDHTDFEEIRKLDAGSWFGEKYAGEKVPTLEEALDLVNGKCGLWIEIKGGAADYPGLEARIVRLIRKKKAHAWVQVISFDTQALKRIHALDPEIKLQKLLVSNLGAFPFFLDKGLRGGSPRRLDFVDGYGIYYKTVHKSLVRRMHKWGKTCNVWTVNGQENIARMRELGVDGITTDEPGWFREQR